MSAIDMLGYAASACVLATFCMKRMLPLRIIAICSNVLFGIFGALAHIYPVLVLHTVLLPVNIARLIQARPITKGTEKLRRVARNGALMRHDGRNFVSLGRANQNRLGISLGDAEIAADAPFFSTCERDQPTVRRPSPGASEFFDIIRANNRNWTGRASIEVELGLKLSKDLSAAHSVPDAIAAYQVWLDERMGAYAEDARRLMSDGQKFINASYRLLSKDLEERRWATPADDQDLRSD